MDIVQRLGDIVGPDYVSTSRDICTSYSYSCFLSSNWVTRPDMVVMPQTTEQVAGVLKLANEFRVPVTPKGPAGGTGHGGPLHGGILLDLAQMDKILLIDEVGMKAVAEAGCSFFKLSQEVFKKGMMLPTTEYGPGPTVAASAITPVNAFGKTRYGRNIDLVEGFEVVLPDGEIINVGSMAYADKEFGPFYRYIHGPDLVGLFTMSNGAYGIVTKVAYSCVHRPPEWSFSAYYWPEDGIEDLTKVVSRATALEYFDVHLNDKWKFAAVEKMLGGKLLPEDAYFLLTFSINAESKAELEAKENTIRELCAQHHGKYVPGIAETFFESWPTFFTPVHHPGSALTFDYTYKEMKGNYMYIYDSINYPVSSLPEVYTKIKEIGIKYGIWGFPRLTVYDGFPMKSQTICSQTWAFINTREPEWVGRIYKCRDEFREWFGKKGGTHQQQLPPIIPQYAWENQKGAHELAKKIKAVLDPNNILSPGTF
jgi:glycolate oxidase